MGKQQIFQVESHPLPLPERKPKPLHDTEKQKNRSCKTCNTPAPIAPRKRENPKNSQYSKPILKTGTRKKIEKREKMKEELETRRQQQMKYYFCAVIGISSLDPILFEIENADRKRKTAFFDLDFSIRKKNYLILRKAIYFFLIEKSRLKNAVFRFRSAFSISHKIGPYYGNLPYGNQKSRELRFLQYLPICSPWTFRQNHSPNIIYTVNRRNQPTAMDLDFLDWVRTRYKTEPETHTKSAHTVL